jgi:hypothetical protein
MFLNSGKKHTEFPQTGNIKQYCILILSITLSLGYRKLGPSDVLGRTCLAFGGQTVAKPGSDTTCQEGLNGAAVEPFEDLRTHAKTFQSPEGE